MDYERKENYKQTTGQVGYVQYSAWEGRGMGIVWLVLQFPRRLTNYSSEFEIQIFLYLDQIHRAYVWNYPKIFSFCLQDPHSTRSLIDLMIFATRFR